MKINIEYEVTTTFQLTVERDELPDDAETLLDSVTRAELADSPCEVNPIEWDHLKYAWRNSTPDNTYITNEDHDELY